MIGDFLAAWPLFGETWIAGWAIAALLGLTGVHVVARDRVFVGVAAAQAATFGVALGLWLGTLGLVVGSGPADEHGHQHGHQHGLGNGFTLAACCGIVAGALAALAGGGGGRLGWIHLAAGAGAVLLLGGTPHGAHEIAHVVASSLLGAGAGDGWLFGGMALLAALLAALLRRPLVLLCVDPAAAAAAGLSRWRWEAALAVWLGLSLGSAIRAAGLLYAVGCLILPALAARACCRRTATQLAVAPLVALLVTGAAFVLAHRWDLPPGQLAVVLLCGAVLPAHALGWLRDRWG